MARAGGKVTTVAAVAAKYGIPEGALAKVFQQLVRVGLATGMRGVGGGYRLARPASRMLMHLAFAASGEGGPAYLDLKVIRPPPH